MRNKLRKRHRYSRPTVIKGIIIDILKDINVKPKTKQKRNNELIH